MKSTLNKSTPLSYKKFLKQPFAIKKKVLNLQNYPIDTHVDEILEKINSNQVIIIQGFTGCG